MYLLTIEDSFASAHQLRGYRGKCENLHGHNWKVELTVKGETLNGIGLLIDFHDLKKMLKEILSILDHKNINDVPPFDKENPSSENLAEFIAGLILEKLAEISPPIQLHSLTVWESDTSRCTYIP
ncbi:MAG: 6-carboxytetrahydropterin synthase QueD [Spirochaetae bacterium HGW-Spirochaetae-1]|jgi:6-pyruvoyltetrahydropterin/6-carboxytetrahydropterin synthase|nr:MAG: 6-carboxytetrahydropterin synthase QueD [Spirochaetae bacterium HGW-Spirochaetae-1]